MNTWTKGLLATAITGSAHGAAASIGTVVFSPGTSLLNVLGIAATSAIVGGLVSLLAYLEKSPIPE